MAIEKQVTLDSQIQLRNDTAAAWKAANPVLLKGEIGIEIDTRKIKIGDGISNWNALRYISDDVVVENKNPSETDTNHEVGKLWVNQSAQLVFVLIATSDSSAVWKRLVTAEEVTVVAEAQTAQRLKEKRTISIKGDATGAAEFDGSEDAVITLVLPNTGASAGTFTKVTVNEKGLIVKTEVLTIDDLPDLNLAKIKDAGTAAAKNVGTSAGDLVALDESGKVPNDLLPAIAITEPHVVANEEEMLALEAQKGDVAIRTDETKSYILKANPASDRTNWLELLSPECKVLSVNGKVGAITLTTDDITEGEKQYFTRERTEAIYDEKIAKLGSADLTDGDTIVHSTDKFILNGGNA